MTVFDRLEDQLLAAHPHRARRSLPRPAPRRIVAFAAAAAAAAAVAAAALSSGSSTSSPTPAAQPGDVVAPVDRAHTTVAVLNASRTPGAAGHVAMELADRGWKIGTVTNYPDQGLGSSCVDFTPGHSQAASIIAEQLGVHNVIPPNPSVVAAAGPLADVIVVVGADRPR
jgi:hypothetical protein